MSRYAQRRAAIALTMRGQRPLSAPRQLVAAQAAVPSSTVANTASASTRGRLTRNAAVKELQLGSGKRPTLLSAAAHAPTSPSPPRRRQLLQLRSPPLDGIARSTVEAPRKRRRDVLMGSSSGGGGSGGSRETARKGAVGAARATGGRVQRRLAVFRERVEEVAKLRQSRGGVGSQLRLSATFATDVPDVDAGASAAELLASAGGTADRATQDDTDVGGLWNRDVGGDEGGDVTRGARDTHMSGVETTVAADVTHAESSEDGKHLTAPSPANASGVATAAAAAPASIANVDVEMQPSSAMRHDGGNDSAVAPGNGGSGVTTDGLDDASVGGDNTAPLATTVDGSSGNGSPGVAEGDGSDRAVLKGASGAAGAGGNDESIIGGGRSASDNDEDDLGNDGDSDSDVDSDGDADSTGDGAPSVRSKEASSASSGENDSDSDGASSGSVSSDSDASGSGSEHEAPASGLPTSARGSVSAAGGPPQQATAGRGAALPRAVAPPCSLSSVFGGFSGGAKPMPTAAALAKAALAKAASAEPSSPSPTPAALRARRRRVLERGASGGSCQLTSLGGLAALNGALAASSSTSPAPSSSAAAPSWAVPVSASPPSPPMSNHGGGDSGGGGGRSSRLQRASADALGTEPSTDDDARKRADAWAAERSPSSTAAVPPPPKRSRRGSLGSVTDGGDSPMSESRSAGGASGCSVSVASDRYLRDRDRCEHGDVVWYKSEGCSWWPAVVATEDGLREEGVTVDDDGIAQSVRVGDDPDTESLSPSAASAASGSPGRQRLFALCFNKPGLWRILPSDPPPVPLCTTDIVRAFAHGAGGERAASAPLFGIRTPAGVPVARSGANGSPNESKRRLYDAVEAAIAHMALALGYLPVSAAFKVGNTVAIRSRTADMCYGVVTHATDDAVEVSYVCVASVNDPASSSSSQRDGDGAAMDVEIDVFASLDALDDDDTDGRRPGAASSETTVNVTHVDELAVGAARLLCPWRPQ